MKKDSQVCKIRTVGVQQEKSGRSDNLCFEHLEVSLPFRSFGMSSIIFVRAFISCFFFSCSSFSFIWMFIPFLLSLDCQNWKPIKNQSSEYRNHSIKQCKINVCITSAVRIILYRTHFFQIGEQCETLQETIVSHDKFIGRIQRCRFEQILYQRIPVIAPGQFGSCSNRVLQPVCKKQVHFFMV